MSEGRAGEPRFAGSAEFEILRTQIAGKPGTWTILGLSAAGVAVPIAVLLAVLAAWLPREFDSTNDLVRAVQGEVSKVAENVDTAVSLAGSNGNKLEALVDVLARDRASPCVRYERDNDQLMLVSEPFREILPWDVYSAVVVPENVNSYFCVDFMDYKYIYAQASAFNKLTGEQQAVFENSTARYDIRFRLE